MTVSILHGDCRDILRTLPDESVHCYVTSPPYFGLRDYNVAGQIGLEPTPEDYVAQMVSVFREVRRVLRDDGTLWLNLGDSYASSGRGGNPTEATSGLQGGQASQRASMVRRSVSRPAGLKEKDLMGIPWLVAFALRADGWFLRQDIIWSKPNPMPESVADRCTKAHEYIFLLSKRVRYYYDVDAIAEDLAGTSYARLAQNLDEQAGSDRVPGKTNGRMKAAMPRMVGTNGPDRSSNGVPNNVGRRRGVPPRHASYATCDRSGLDNVGRGMCRNKRSVWTVATQPFKEAHFATFPPALIEPCILAGCPSGGTVLDPFGGSGTTGMVADRLGRHAILIELNPDYIALSERRCRSDAGIFAAVNVDRPG